MANKKHGEPPLLAAVREVATALLPPEERTADRIAAATLLRLALVAPDVFEAVRASLRSSRDKEGRWLRMAADAIHAELWEQPPWTSDRVIRPELDAVYPETGGRPTPGSVLRSQQLYQRDVDRRQLDALTLRLRVELVGDPWHGMTEEDGPGIDLATTEEQANAALRSAGVAVESPVIPETAERMMEERHRRYRTPRGMRVHRPQEWAAVALLRLWGHPDPVPWPAARALLNELARGSSKPFR